MPSKNTFYIKNTYLISIWFTKTVIDLIINSITVAIVWLAGITNHISVIIELITVSFVNTIVASVSNLMSKKSLLIIKMPNVTTKLCLTYSNVIRTHNHLVRKRTLNHSAKNLPSLTIWLNVRLRTKWLWVRIPLLSRKLPISCLFWARSSLMFCQL